jgi:multidrug efflux pump
MNFNLSAWALKNRQLVLYFMILLGIAGAVSYTKLGQSEDPPFTFKVMVIKTLWPGANAEEVAKLVSDPIEKKVMETGDYEKVISYSRPGESLVTFVARDAMHSSKIPALWYQVRKKVGDIKHTLPQGVQGPYFNDEFGDTYGNIYALTGKGFDYATLKDYADRIQLQLERVADVGKVDLVGLQDEKIWVEVSNTKIASLGLPLQTVQDALQAQNAISPSGFFETPTDRIQLRVSGRFKSVDDIKNFPIQVAGRSFILSDIADVYRGFSDPAQPRMRFMGEDAIGIEVSMKAGGDILGLGKNLESKFSEIQKNLPVGMQLGKVSDQPAAVKTGVSEFLDALGEAVIIVLLVSFFSLGFRTGMVVALAIPLVLAMTFAAMFVLDIGLHKISLGALVLALGLLVDDAIIAVEMMLIKLEQGFTRLQAASFAWSSTAFPMLTGTLITAAGFLPIATAQSGTGEYTRSIFEVVTIALLLSWLAAVIFVPYLGDLLLPDFAKRKKPKTDNDATIDTEHSASTVHPDHSQIHDHAHTQDHTQAHDPYATKFYDRFRRIVHWCINYRKIVIAITVAAFVGSIVLFGLVQQQFFPDSSRLELMVDMKLAEGASLTSTEAQAKKLEALLKTRKGIDNYVAYIGSGSPRFYLPLDQQLPQASFAQFVILAKTLKDREEIREWLITTLHQSFPDIRTRVARLENGPPVGYPVQLRVSGEDIQTVRKIAREVAVKVQDNPHVVNVHLDWEEPSKSIFLNVDQDRARALGVTSQDLANFLQSALTGVTVSKYRENISLIDIQVRGAALDRKEVSSLSSLAIPTTHGGTVPLSQIATIEYGFEEGIIWRRDRLPTVTVRADIYDNSQAVSLVNQILPTLDGIRAKLPYGYQLAIGGTIEDAARGQASVNAGVPLFLVVVITLLMLQLRSASRTAIVFLTAPLGLIGVSIFLLVFQQPFGFVAMLGTIALSGMIMRNSLILIDQIEQDISAGRTQWDAIIEATVRRLRPIVLTALAAVLAMVPLSRSVFFGPMAVAIMGGLIVATALTLLFLPALYAAWFRVQKDPAPNVTRPS